MLTIHLLGRFEARWNDRPIESLSGQRAQELVAYVVLRGHRPLLRETLAEELWGGDDGGSDPRKNLRHALWQVQSALAASGPGGERVLTVHKEWIQISPTAPISVDTNQLERAFEQARGVSGEDFGAPLVEKLRASVALYQGQLLENCYRDWCILDRERYHAMYLVLLDKLISNAEATGQLEDGMTYAQDVLRNDRASERTHRRMMRLRYRAGDRTGALRQFDACVAALKEELDVPPAAATVALREVIERDLPVTSGDYPAIREAPWLASASASTAVGMLRSLRDSLANTEAVLSSLIGAFEARPGGSAAP
jgi:DNA-binding SARP family transcriptional activator